MEKQKCEYFSPTVLLQGNLSEMPSDVVLENLLGNKYVNNYRLAFVLKLKCEYMNLFPLLGMRERKLKKIIYE